MHKLTLNSVEVDSEYTAMHYACDFVVTTAGDGLWGCEAGRDIKVTGISVTTSACDDGVAVAISVAHDSAWDVYTDSAFAAAISAALGVDVQFTEQGMQDDELASMELA